MSPSKAIVTGLPVIGGLNWGLVGAAKLDLVAKLTGSRSADLKPDHPTGISSQTAGLSRLRSQRQTLNQEGDGHAVSVGETVAAARPDAIVHMMTAISMAHAGKPDLKHIDRLFATTNRLRTEGRTTCWPRPKQPGVQRRRAELRQL